MTLKVGKTFEKGIAAIGPMETEIKIIKSVAFSRPPAFTLTTCAARLVRQNDMIAGPDGLYFFPRQLDDARSV